MCRETERVAETEHDAIVELPAIVGIRPIVVKPQLAVVVALHIEDVRVVVRVRIVRRAIRATAHRMLSRLYRICDLKSTSATHQVSSFFEVSAYTTPFQTLVGNALDVWILGSAAGNRNRPHIRLLPNIF